jgi:hypothetical protein
MTVNMKIIFDSDINLEYFLFSGKPLQSSLDLKLRVVAALTPMYSSPTKHLPD